MGKNNVKFDIDECVSNYLKSLKNFKSLKKDEERKYLLDYKLNNNLESRNIVLQSNLKYACSLANTYRGKGVDFSELISEANDGLIEAIEKYDIKQDIKFITYAKWWIIQRINLCIALKYKNKTFDFPNENDEDNIETEEQTNKNEYGDFIIDEIDYEITNNDKKYYVNSLLNKLNERERDIISRYFGLYGNKENLYEISNTYNLSSERIRQVMESAMKKLRTYAL